MHALLTLGRRAVLRALLEARTTVQRGGEYGYLLNRIWLDEYLVWLQTLPPIALAQLAESLDAEAAALGDEALGWPLKAYEQLAQDGDDDE